MCLIKVVEPLDWSDKYFELIFEGESIFDGKVEEVGAMIVNYVNRYGLLENAFRK